MVVMDDECEDTVKLHFKRCSDRLELISKLADKSTQMLYSKQLMTL